MLHIDALNSILSYHREGIPVSVMSISNESLITRARNTMISIFHTMKDFTHLLWLDADIGFPAPELAKLIRAQKDVIVVRKFC